MALVPFRVSGAAADQGAEERLFVIGGDAITIRQRPAAAKAMRDHALRAVLQAAGQLEAPGGDAASGLQQQGGEQSEDLGHVGLVVWQSAFLLAELLLRAPPFGGWGDVRVVDLGTGTGVVAIALARAGADVVAADLPHVTPLTRENVGLNCGTSLHRCQVADHAWGTDVAPIGAPPDIITGADVVYEEQHYPALLATLTALAAPHTLVFLASRLRGRREERFENMLADSGFAVERVPPEQLHPEYRDGEYRVLRAAKRDGAVEPAAAWAAPPAVAAAVEEAAAA